eukprot:CAMPEP_0194370760 /NCGR_PEP_ID=MMETSP0174-20130528/19102_1 /TAXON_ID=216777 /ORGANISM="Proboscia alata, Strain PI-D3" /LENGTH=1215 /DNA_ID=CAMNT_0039148423 /DNA_START=37 /DNA_END=3681 /DNA_ORIENTATION=+
MAKKRAQSGRKQKATESAVSKAEESVASKANELAASLDRIEEEIPKGTRQQPEPLKSIVSDSSSSDDDSSSSSSEESSTNEPSKELAVKGDGTSRLYAPHRTLGIISNGHPFDYNEVGGSNGSTNTIEQFVTVPIGDRFQIVKCDSLRPALLSNCLPTSSNSSRSSPEMTFVVADPNLSITVAATSENKLVLYHRTNLVDTFELPDDCQGMVIRHVLRLGKRNVGEKKLSAQLLVGVLLGGEVAEEDEDSSDEDVTKPSQVLILAANRTSLQSLSDGTGIPLSDTDGEVLCHPSAYLNKILVGGRHIETDGPALTLVNIRSRQIIHEFACLPSDSDSVTSLIQSPAMDTVAVGTRNGNIHLVNTKHDVLLFSLRHVSKSSATITSLSFRTDVSSSSHPLLAAGCVDGTITVWNLQTRRLQTTFSPHAGGVSCLAFLPREPILLSIGTTSNSITMHIFDNGTSPPRLLRSRSGHAHPPTLLRYLRTNAVLCPDILDGTDPRTCQILSCEREMRVVSSARSVLDRTMGQGPGLEKKAKLLGVEREELLLPRVVGLDVCETRSRDWGDIVTIHSNHAHAYVWSSRSSSQSGPVLRQTDWSVNTFNLPPPPSTHATCLVITRCGNFCLVGTKGGVIYKYNVQSGIPRGCYPQPWLGEEKAKKGGQMGSVGRTMRALGVEEGAVESGDMNQLEKDNKGHAVKMEMDRKRRVKAKHDVKVVGLALDALNRTVISVDQSGKILLWNFLTHTPHKKSPIQLTENSAPAGVSHMTHMTDVNLCAMALHSGTILLFDTTALRVVRRLHHAPALTQNTQVTDMAFGKPDGRRFYVLMGHSILIYDIPTGMCVDWLSLTKRPTSLTLSSNGEFMVTSHVGCKGLSMWIDKSYFGRVVLDGGGTKGNLQQGYLMGGVQAEEESETNTPAPIENKPPTEQEIKESNHNSVSISPKAPGLITLSTLPQVQWRQLFHLELIKQRNKPKLPPTKPKSAPFFLQYRGGQSMDGAGAVEEKEKDKNDEEGEEVWDAAWVDDDDEDTNSKKRTLEDASDSAKRPKLTVNKTADLIHSVSHRSTLATLLLRHSTLTPSSTTTSTGNKYHPITLHLSTLGPSSIDVELSSLCRGSHDVSLETLHLLQLSMDWLHEGFFGKSNYELCNAYLHRFLKIHSLILSGIEEKSNSEEIEDGDLDKIGKKRLELQSSLTRLKCAQQEANQRLKQKMQHTLCLL